MTARIAKRPGALLYIAVTVPCLGTCAFSLTATRPAHLGIIAGIEKSSRWPIVSQVATPPAGFSRTSPLFVATELEQDANATPAVSAPVLREIEKKMEKVNREKQRAAAKLNEAEETLQKLEAKKREYLMGPGAKLAETPTGGNFSETTVRSAVKAFCWRLVAGLVTFITSLQFSGSVKTALSIVGSDFFSKAFTMFIGERLMNKSQAGRKSGADDVGRSLAKALIWRLFAICNTLTMSLLISKDLKMASKIAGSDAIFKTGLMFVYERVWARIEWGKEYLIEFSI